jgi:hypothetical protein
MTPYEGEEAVKLTVLTEEHGKIIAAVRPPGTQSGDGPISVKIVPSSGQTIHEIALPAGPEHTRILESIGSFRVSREGDRATLIGED